MTTTTGFRFNKSYDDLEQVREFMPAFLARLHALEAAGKYRYNDAFKGHVPGIEGPDEDTAIYLLQGLEHQDRQGEKVAALLADGYRWLDELAETQRFTHICLVPTRRNGGEWAEYHDARVVPCSVAWPNGAGKRTPNAPGVILPKGRRSHGYMVNDRRLLVL